MRGVVLARLPDFMQEKLARQIRRAVQIVLQAAFFPPRRRHKRAQLRFQEQFLALFGTDYCGKRHRVLGKFGDPHASGPSAGGPGPCAFLRFFVWPCRRGLYSIWGQEQLDL